MKRKILCFGDSNTYGYDPRGFCAGRYPEEDIWTSLLEKSLGGEWTVINEGMNGRRLPQPGRYDYAGRLTDSLGAGDYFAVMLGSNDILCAEYGSIDIAVRSMKSFLIWLTGRLEPSNIIVIGPPYAGSADDPDPVYRHFYAESVDMNEEFRELAGKYGCLFADASKWNVETAYDGLHFSEAGHQTFAAKLREWMDQARII